MIIDLFIQNGGNWKHIAQQLGRPADCVKNRYYGTIKKRLTPYQKQLLSKGSIQENIEKPLREKHFNPNSVDAIFNAFWGAESDETSADGVGSLVVDGETSKQPSDEEKRKKIQGLHNQIAVLQAFIIKTKRDINQHKAV